MPAVGIEASDAGAVVRIRAAPGASRERIAGLHGDALKVAVQAPPEKGKANRRIGELLAKALGIPPRDVELLTGATARDKRFLIRGVAADELRRRIDVLLSNGS